MPRIKAWWLAATLPLLIVGGLIAAEELVRRPGASRQGLSPDPAAPRPIAAGDSLWIEKLTWMEIRDAIASGATTVIVPVGGIEQNGPYVVSGKHNVILQATAPAIARKLGNALIAPVVPFVPQGAIAPPSGHMRYPGTISIGEDTYRALLSDIARSLAAHGFRRIIFIGDSGGNQEGMRHVARLLSAEWRDSGREVVYVPEYYDWDDRAAWLAERGVVEREQGYHDELSVQAMMLTVDPQAIRMEQRLAAGKFSINEVSLAPVERTLALGHGLIDHIATRTVQATQRRAK